MGPSPSFRFAELHLHLGGAVLPRILYAYLEREMSAEPDSEFSQNAKVIREQFPEYAAFEERLTRHCRSLNEYLDAHKLVEPLQTVDSLPYFVYRLLRGAAVFEGISYLELRYNPRFRVAKHLSPPEARKRMEDVVSTVHQAAANAVRWFPIQFTQILCMDSRLSVEENRAIIDLAADMHDEVCAVDLAGPNECYQDRVAEFVALFEYAKSKGLKTTAHLYETPAGCIPELLPLVDRIGHGIQLALSHRNLLVGVAARGQCLEVCPTSYLRTGTLNSYTELKPVFQRCFDLGVDVAICTDNMAFHGVRLPLEHEQLLLSRVLSFSEMDRCRQAAFRHAFRYRSSILS